VSVGTNEFVWPTASAFGRVPAIVAPRSPAGVALYRWWSAPRQFGCQHLRVPWVPPIVALPDTRLWCPGCVMERVTTEHRCAGCERELADGEAASALWMESRGIRFVGRFGRCCMKEESEHGA